MDMEATTSKQNEHLPRRRARTPLVLDSAGCGQADTEITAPASTEAVGTASRGSSAGTGSEPALFDLPFIWLG